MNSYRCSDLKTSVGASPNLLFVFCIFCSVYSIRPQFSVAVNGFAVRESMSGHRKFLNQAVWEGGGQDDIFCPGSISGQMAVVQLLGTTGEQATHAAQMIFVSEGDQLCPGLNRADL